MKSIIKTVAKEFNSSNIPNVLLKKNTVLGHTSRTIADNHMSNLSGTESLEASGYTGDFGSLAKDFTSLLNSDSIASESINYEISKITKPIVAEFNIAMENIHNAKKRVNTLVSKVDETYNKLLAANPISSIHLNLKTNSTDVKRINWNILNSLNVSNEYLIESVHNTNDIKGKDVNQNTIDLIGKRLVYNNTEETSLATLDKDISESKLKEIIRAVKTSTKDILSMEEFKLAIETIMDTNKCQRFINTIISMNQSGVKPAATCLRYLDYIKALVPAVNVLKQGVVELSNESMDKLIGRLNSITNYIEYAAYVVNYHREHSFNNILVIGDHRTNNGVYNSVEDILINPDTEVKNTDLEMQDIVHYMEYMYKNKLVPVKGVELKSIVSYMPNIKTRIANDSKNITSKLKIIQTNAKRDALSFVLSSESFNTPKFSNINVQEFVKHTVGYSVVTNLTTEDIIYNIIIGLEHKGTFTETVFKKFSEGYVKLSTEQNNISDLDITALECSTMSDILSDYLVKKFVM
jgi:hypothetical protein